MIKNKTNSNNKNNQSMVEYEESFLTKIVNKFKNIFKKQTRKEMKMSENTCKCGGNSKDEFMDGLLNKYEPQKDNLIQILNSVQEHYGYVPESAQKEISEYLKMPMAEIYGVITFYSRFTLKPKGKYNIAICMGTACFVKGSEKIMDRAKEKLGIEPGETTTNGIFSLEETRCVGACGLAPVFTVNGEVYGSATVQKLDQVIDEIIAKEENK